MTQKGSYKQVDIGVVRVVVGQLGGQFSTRDVSDDGRMLTAHPSLRLHSHYHAFVGRAISEYRSELGVDELRKGTARGSVWGKKATSAAPAPARAAVPPLADRSGDALDLGPQYGRDSPFTARMRRHQSWYRAAVLRVPCGTGPRPDSTARYGNMLTRGDGARGLNFLTPAAFRVAQERVAAGGGAVEPFRLFHNMLSSMPMCFNLFGPLVGEPALAGRLVGGLLPGEVAEVRAVHLEYAPEPASGYLDDRTAFDAFIEYRRPDGALAALGIETKLTEAFSGRHYDRPAYRRWMQGPRSPWREDAHDLVDAVEHNQLWRDHLLAVALRDRAGSPYAACRLALVRHPEDWDCAGVVAGYRELLKPEDDTFLDLPLDELLDRWAAGEPGAPHDGWLGELRRRYLDLQLGDG